jgi:hypothetical protein
MSREVIGAALIFRRGKHRKDCHAMRLMKAGDWSIAWSCVHDLPWRKRGGQWLRIKCNDMRCKAELLIQVDSVLPKE